MSFYYVWKGYARNSDQTQLNLIETPKLISEIKRLSFKEEVDFEKIDSFIKNNGHEFKFIEGDEYGTCLIVLKITNGSLEELRIISSYGVGNKNIDFNFSTIRKSSDKHENIFKDIDVKDILLENNFIQQGFSDLQLINSSNINIETGKVTFINPVDYFPTEKKSEITLIENEVNNNLQIVKILKGKNSDYEFINSASDTHSFSFTWEKGMYEVGDLIVEKPKTILSNEDAQVHFPCCNKNINFDLQFLQNRWGVLNLYCKDCNEYHIKIDDYLMNKNQKIDFKTTGIEGYKDEKEKLSYGCVIRPIKYKEKIDFITK